MSGKGREGSVLKSREMESDERLLIEAAQQDPSRFAELYEIHFDRVYAFIARRVRDRSEAQDLTSHVFYQAMVNLGRFEWRGAPFAAWLFRIASNSIANHYQRLAKEQNVPTPNSPEADLEEVERQARLFRLVRRLPADQQRVIQMRFAEEKSIREIASELGRSGGDIPLSVAGRRRPPRDGAHRRLGDRNGRGAWRGAANASVNLPVCR
jgi:RNA polymerase sigma-70 factor, ECF subfamily